MDDLVRQLNQLRVDRNDAATEYHRSVEDSSRREIAILEEIRQQNNDRRRQNAQFHNNVRDNRRNPITQGDTVRITNDYKPEETGIVGTVIHVTNRMVQLRAVTKDSH